MDEARDDADDDAGAFDTVLLRGGDVDGCAVDIALERDGGGGLTSCSPDDEISQKRSCDGAIGCRLRHIDPAVHSNFSNRF